MKQIKQFRYHSSTSPDNYPQYANYYSKLIHGNIFASHGNISHLGIQAIPGTKFYLNNSQYPIAVGHTGIYELDLNGYGHIFAIRFDKATLDRYDDDEINDKILIDIVFEGGV